MQRRAGLLGFSFVLILSIASHSAEAGCSCTSKTCYCSGDDASDLSGLLVEDICTEGGTFTRLVLQDVPNLINLQQGFTALRESRCDGLKQLEVLELHQTGIQNLSSNLFQGLPVLKSLDLSNNSYLKSYRDGSFTKIGNTLLELVATDNRVHSLTKGVFADLKNLQRLILARNKIGYIEDGVFSSGCCGHLKELSLEGNILTDLEDATFVGLRNLQKLDLRGNPLQRLSPRLFSPFASSLTHLWMSHDDSATFGGFDTLPNGLFTKMAMLEELSMVELKITNLTADSFTGLTNLKKLSLRGNRLTVLPKGCFTSLPQLEELDLSANGMVCIPDNSEDHYVKLRSLDLSLNGLTHLTRRTFSMLASSHPTPGFPRLLVNISFNPIRRIEPDAFCSFDGPVKLILAPEGAKVPSWAVMDGWPDNPFALVGNGSVIQGLDRSGVVEGRSDAAALCGPEGHLFRAKILTSSLYKNSKYTDKDIDNSLNSECPWLLPDELSPWQLSKLGVPGLPRVPGGSDGSYALEEGSRIYLLIIVAVCITFLLAALTVIMCYRAWSRRATQKVVGAAEANVGNVGGSRSMEPLTTIGEVSEKQDLLERMRNGKVATTPEAEGHEASPERCTSRGGRRNSEPKGEEMEAMTAANFADICFCAILELGAELAQSILPPQSSPLPVSLSLPSYKTRRIFSLPLLSLMYTKRNSSCSWSFLFLSLCTYMHICIYASAPEAGCTASTGSDFDKKK
ncbi:leucine rich repeat containing protein 15 [Echinococcus multilocularis]|uniref:Leucine rich repeat containing protein 15 n=1 Tax=Echinococcus multilocularis TaxID=6211 RepID=A0A068Y3K9_ECHMU|nr:leucine rich repeat containing protein 15 [Echinococcus multilocularis]